MKISSQAKGHAAMLTANASWGLMSPLAKIVMGTGLVTPIVLTDLRLFGAMVLFWLVSFLQKPEHVSHRDLARLFVASMLAIVLNQGSFIFGVSLSSPADASIITTSMPLWAMVLAAFYLKEPITGKKVLGIASGAVGALLLIMAGANFDAGSAAAPSARSICGDLLVLFAQLSYASYLVFFKHFAERYSLVTIMKWMFTYAFVCTLPVSYHGLATTQWAAFTPEMWASIAFIVCIATFVSYMFIVVGQKSLRPTVAGMYNYVQPIVACIVTISLGMDRVTPLKCVAVLLIFGGVYLVSISRNRQQVENYEKSKNSEASATEGK